MLTRFRQYIYVSLLAICFSIACLGEWQSSLDQPQKENSTQSTPNKKFGEFPWYPSSSDWAAIFSGLLVFSTTGLWVVTRTAANAAKKAADVAEQALTVLERPYIFIDAITIAPITQYRLGQPSYVLKNYGKTPAVIRWCEVQAILIDRGRGKETSLDAKQIFNGQLIIGVGESKPLPIGGHIDFTGVDVTSRVDVTAIRQDTISLRVEITYFDVFNYFHVAEFSFFEGDDSFIPIAGNPNDRQKSKKLDKGETWSPGLSKRLLSEP